MNNLILKRPPPPKFNWNIIENHSSEETKHQSSCLKSDKRR